MGGKSRAQFEKRRKEVARQERQKEKRTRRQEAQEAKERKAGEGLEGEEVDPDLVGIQPGPQPLPEELQDQEEEA